MPVNAANPAASPIADPAAIAPTMNIPAAGTPAVDAALQLRDIHLPQPVSWWPIAPGWWLLLAVIILLVALTLITRRIYRNRQIRRDINSELDRIKRSYHKTLNKTQLAKDLSILLRRASISLYPETDIAGLIGDDWLTFLDSSGNTDGNTGSSLNFNSDTGRVLLTAPYLPADAESESQFGFDAEALIKLCESWLRSSHKPAHAARLTVASKNRVAAS